jgi:hypothetical protein
MRAPISKVRSLALASAAVLSLVGCGQEPAEGDADVGVQQSNLWMKAGNVKWPGHDIIVCFDPAVPAAFRTRVQAKVENSWERVGNLDFRSWGTCAMPPSGSLVAVSIDGTIAAPGSGAAAQGLTYRLRDPATGPTKVVFRNTTVSDGTIIHEFGHVLGWADEDADGAPCTQRTSGGTSLESEGDLWSSIMTSGGNCGLAQTLSAWDVLGTRTMYGQRPPGEITGVNGLDVAIAGAKTGNNVAVVGWRMLGGDWNGRFRRTSVVGRTLAAKTPSIINRCLAVQGGAVGGGFTPVVAKDCDAAAPQLFDFTQTAWLAMGNRCVEASSFTAGGTLSIRTCSGIPKQQWDFFHASNQIRLSGTNQCVSIPNGSTALGTKPTLQTCSSGASNQVYVYSEERIRFGDKCMNVATGTAADGNPIVLWDGCDYVPRYPNTQFTIRGPIKAMGQCLTMQGGIAYDGVALGVEPCSTAATQVWEYAW